MKRRLKVMDFDGTLVNTPGPDSLIEGIPARRFYENWHKSSGSTKKPFVGWWGRVETLLPPIFGRLDEDGNWELPEGVLNEELATLHKQHREDPENLVVLMTGRHRKMQHPTEKEHVSRVILDRLGLFFDEYYYSCDFRPTLTFKCDTIIEVLEANPTIEDVEIWEDREAHYSSFWDFIKYLKKEGSIKGGQAHLVALPQGIWEG